MSAEQITDARIEELRGFYLMSGFEGYKDWEVLQILDALTASRAEVQRLTDEARRSDAERVEVPELTAEDAHHELLRVSRENSYNGAEEEAFYDGYNFARSRARIVPSPQPAIRITAIGDDGAPREVAYSSTSEYRPDGSVEHVSQVGGVVTSRTVTPAPQPVKGTVDRHQLLPALPASRVSEMVGQLAGCSMEECIRDVWNTARDEINLPQPSADVVVVPSGLELAAIGRKHFGNPIPQTWYAAARELVDALRSSTNHDAQDAAQPTTNDETRG